MRFNQSKLKTNMDTSTEQFIILVSTVKLAVQLLSETHKFN